MAKNKQQRPKRKKLTAHFENKEAMRQVMATLAESKAKNRLITPHLTSITQSNNKKKAIRKQKQRKQSAHLSEPESAAQQKPAVNIFALDYFEAEKPVIINVKNREMEEQLDLESQARKAMGGSFNSQKFGDKPLKMIEEKEEIIVSEDEENHQAGSHPHLKVPLGNLALQRSEEIKQVRSKLPICMKEQQIVEAINSNLVTLVCGETGSGKSTQLPQFLAEKNYQSLGKIAITQPRRLATISLARRVAEEMSFRVSKQVAYQVRHERKQSKQSYIKFMTDGILLKEMSSDPLLLEYSIVIIDQAHERKVNTDILIGLLSKLILVRYKMSIDGAHPPLRLVIMSATLRIADFQNEKLFNFPVPIISVESKMYPVTIFHEKKTPESYIDSAIKKCIKIYKSLPPGDVLVFLTGKEEIHEMSVRLEVELERCSFEDGLEMSDNEEEQKVEGEQFEPESHARSKSFTILKLYSSLPTKEQDRIFQASAPQARKFIISTNIAETSITVPNVRYIIDSGQEKHRYFDGIWKWRKGWGSKAMAAQRAGRAGRTAHGYCYRLYSSALYANIMEEYPEPQISKQPLESVLLQIKSIGFINAYAFPFPTAPNPQAIWDALSCLAQIRAIEGSFSAQFDQANITEMGKVISFLPLAPRLAKMLLIGRRQKIEHYTLLCTLLLTVENIYKTNYGELSDFDSSSNPKQQLFQRNHSEANKFREKYHSFIQKDSGSDIFTSMNIVGSFLSKVVQNQRLPLLKAIEIESSRLELNSNVMRQFYYNCDQLCEIYETLTESKINLALYQQPSHSQLQSLLELLLVSFDKNVCHLEENNRYKNRQQQEVFIHRSSSLYLKKHLFVGCVDFFESQAGRKYLQYPFVINNYQLLASFGKILQPHDYAWRNEALVGLTSGEISGWEIPNLIAREVNSQLKYYAVGRMLLSGVIVPSFKILAERNWLTSPVSSIRPDNLQEKVQRLIMTLRTWKVTSSQQLAHLTASDPQFLYRELQLWLNVKNYKSVYEKLRSSIINLSNHQ